MRDLRRIGRRDFLRYTGTGIATIVVGCGGSGGGGLGIDDDDDDDGDGNGGNGGNGDDGNGGELPPISETLRFTITDALKEMVTHTPDSLLPNAAECYFWVFKEDRFLAECPGPQIFAVEGQRVRLEVTNDLEGRHAFFIPGPTPNDPPMVDTGPIEPGERVEIEFTVGAAGTYLYHDNLNAPVNRVMGLHGAFVVMPKAAAAGHKLTPYANPSAAVQRLYDDFGTAPWWPGLSWEAGDPRGALDGLRESSFAPPTRQHIWLCHQASPVLFEEVGLFAQGNPGQDYPAAQFVDLFLNDPFVNTSNDPRTGTNADFPVTTAQFNRKPHFFTINGQSGFYAHDHPSITPMYRVGEPALVRILNAGLWAHSMHLHANHFYVTAVNNVPQENPLWVDVFNLHPMDHVDYTIPFMRPPDVPNQRGIGRADPGLLTQSGQPSWPPIQELGMRNPPLGTMKQSFADPNVLVDITHLQSPLCYPMHDHSEPTQVAQGGNYNCGLIAGVYFLGDRNTPGQMNFPMDEDFRMMLEGGGSTSATGPAAGDEIEHDH